MKKIVSRISGIALLAILGLGGIAWVISYNRPATSPEVAVAEEPVVQMVEVQPEVAQTVQVPMDTNQLKARITGISFAGGRK